jgi:hypothetical protein
MRRLKLSAKDAKIKAESEKANAAPSKLDSWMKEQARTSHSKQTDIGQSVSVRTVPFAHAKTPVAGAACQVS